MQNNSLLEEKISQLYSKYQDDKTTVFDSASIDWKIIYLYKEKNDQSAFAILFQKYEPLKIKYLTNIKKFSSSDFESDYLEMFFEAVNYVQFDKIKDPKKFSFDIILRQKILNYIRDKAGKKENSKSFFSEIQENQISDIQDEKKDKESPPDINEKIFDLVKDNENELKILEIKNKNPGIKKYEIAKRLDLSTYAISRYFRDIKEKIIGANISNQKPKLTANQIKILEIKKSNPKIKQKDICQKLGFTKSTVSREIARLKKMGVL